MTNKIELLTNSLSDPDFIGTSIDGMNGIILFDYSGDTFYLLLIFRKIISTRKFVRR